MCMALKEEHVYIGISESEVWSSMEASENNETKKKGLNLKATELRLGLPGSESPEREIGHGVEDKNGIYSLGVLKGLVSGAKRGFFDTINGDCCGKWILNGISVGSELNFSPKGVYAPVKPIGVGEAVISTSQSFMAFTSGREAAVSSSTGLGQEKKPQISTLIGHGIAPAPAPKAQVVGWPPVRSFRKNSMTNNPPKTDEKADAKLGTSYVKVSMDGAPYLRKVHLKTYNSYKDLSSALEKMFSCFTIGQCGSHGVPIQDENSESRLMDLLHGSEYVLTYEDKDGDWMLVGDVPWDMFIGSCKRMRIMKSSDAVGLGGKSHGQHSPWGVFLKLQGPGKSARSVNY